MWELGCGGADLPRCRGGRWQSGVQTDAHLAPKRVTSCRHMKPHARRKGTAGVQEGGLVPMRESEGRLESRKETQGARVGVCREGLCAMGQAELTGSCPPTHTMQL